MSFTSVFFILFLSLTTLLYYLAPKRYQWCVLLVVSYVFYWLNGPAAIPYLVGTTLVNYGAARMMQKRRDAFRARTDLTKEQRREQKKAVNRDIHRIQVVAVLLNLAVLVVVKYLAFMVGNVNGALGLFGIGAKLPVPNILAPLGVSFYTFASIGYIIDIGRGKYDAERNLGKFALFISFFPSIIQGPINRYNDVGKQLSQPHRFSYENLTFGAQLILWGFFKKLVIADRVSAIVNTVFTPDVNAYTGTVHFIAMLAYAVQIYCDFSGGIDVARGAAQVLGIDLPQNFERPYFSTTISEYWRRWHMTLGAWMRDYVFYPVMLSKTVTRIGKFARQRFGSYGAKIVPTVITSFVVFFLVGIWHGASWRYVAFGLYNATVVAGGVALTPLLQKLTLKLKIRTDTFSWKLFQILRTFMIACVAKVLARSWSLKTALAALRKIATEHTPWVYTDGTLFSLGLDQLQMFILFVALIVLITVSILQERGVKMRETIARQNLVFRWVVWIVAVFVVILFGVYGSTYNAADFIYAGF